MNEINLTQWLLFSGTQMLMTLCTFAITVWLIYKLSRDTDKKFDKLTARIDNVRDTLTERIDNVRSELGERIDKLSERVAHLTRNSEQFFSWMRGKEGESFHPTRLDEKPAAPMGAERPRKAPTSARVRQDSKRKRSAKKVKQALVVQDDSDKPQTNKN